MDHNNELRDRNLIREVVDTYSEPENFPRSHVSPLAESILQLIDDARADERRAVHADIAERALSDGVVETVAIASYRAGRTQPLPDGITDAMIRDSDRWKQGKRFYLEEAHAGITAMLLALGVTESESTDEQ